MEALNGEHFLSQCSGDKGRRERQVAELMNCVCLRAEQLNLMNIALLFSSHGPARYKRNIILRKLILCKQLTSVG